MDEPNTDDSQQVPQDPTGVDWRQVAIRGTMIVLIVVGIILLIKLLRRGGAGVVMAAAVPLAAAAARLEQDIVRERVKAGLGRARPQGARLGRPMAPVKPEDVSLLKQQGLSLPEIAEQLHCSLSTVKRRLKRTLFFDRPRSLS